MQTLRLSVEFFCALAFINCFIPIGGSFINSESARDLKSIENSQKTKALLQQDEGNLIKCAYPKTKMDPSKNKIVKNVLKKDKDLQTMSSIDQKLTSGASVSTDQMLSAYAPEFCPQETSSSRSVPPTKKVGLNYPHDVSRGSKSHHGHNSVPLQRLEMVDLRVLVPVNTPMVLEVKPLIQTSDFGQKYNKMLDKQQIHLLEHIDSQNRQILGSQAEPKRKTYNHGKTSLSKMSDLVAESNVSLKPQTTNALAGSSKHDMQEINLETLPTEKDVQIQERHQIPVVEDLSNNGHKSKKDDIKYSESNSMVAKERNLLYRKDESPSQIFNAERTSSINHVTLIENVMKPVKLPLIKSQIESHHEMIPEIPRSPKLDPLRSKLRSERKPLMESSKEVSIKKSVPRENLLKYQVSNKIEPDNSNTEIPGKISQDGDDWIIPKKTFKNNQIGKVNLFQGSTISDLPKLPEGSPSDPLKSLEDFKTSPTKLQKSIKKPKKKKKSNSKVSKVVEEDWDTKLLKALKETSVSDEKIGTEHENLVKNVQKRLQDFFVSYNHPPRKIDVPFSRPSIHLQYYSLIEEFLCLQNPAALLELQLTSQTFESLCQAEKSDPMLHDTNFWLNMIDKILENKPTSVKDLELLRRGRAFIVQYALRKDTELFKEEKHTWSQEGREIATLLKYENPFEMFLDSTPKEIEVLKHHLEVMKAAEHDKELSRYLSSYSIQFRSTMIDLRHQELERRIPYSFFFGRDFLEKAIQQGLIVLGFRQFEIALELSAPEVSWKGFKKDDLETRYLQVLDVLAGMPGATPSSAEDAEATLYSQARHNWRNSRLHQVIEDDPELSKHVIARFKSLLLSLKGQKPRPLRDIYHNFELLMQPELGEKLISRDEAMAATFTDIHYTI
ncbi:hypothetical protein DFH28DRAFT_101262 [Melampsora americana]|nr:hypothetical protein DFH28DRAFT_101262 [Melampsora americana]